MTEQQLQKRRKQNHKYEKTPKGFLMRCYRNMLSRVTGVQKNKIHLYLGKEIMPKEEFYKWAMEHPDFIRLFDNYKEKGFKRGLAPSPDRKESNKGYVISNLEWVTSSLNSIRANETRYREETAPVTTDKDEDAPF